MKLRLPGRRPAAAPAPDPSAELTQQLVNSGKGRPTPKRSEAQVRRPGPPPPPPTNRKEAYRRMREQQARDRASTRVGALRGEDSSLPARDRGPVRRLVRDIVDSRRNVGSAFVLLAAVLLVSVFIPNAAAQGYASLVALVFFLFLAIDSVILRKRIRALVTERFPNNEQKMRSLVWYGISRSTMIRKWRFPKAQVGLGADI